MGHNIVRNIKRQKERRRQRDAARDAVVKFIADKQLGVCPNCKFPLRTKNNWAFCPNSKSRPDRENKQRCSFKSIPLVKKPIEVECCKDFPECGHELGSCPAQPFREPDYPINPGKPDKAFARWQVEVERYRRKMKERNLEPLV